MDLFDQLLMAHKQGMRFSLDSGETAERHYRRGTRGDADAHPAQNQYYYRMRAAHNAKVQGGGYARVTR